MDNEEKLFPIPENIQLEEFNNSLTIAYKWSRFRGYLILSFSLFWNSIVFFLFTAITSEGNTSIFTFFFLAPLIAMGIFLSYLGMANILNKTIINVSFDNVTIKDTPLPCGVSKNISKYDIKQIYVKHHVKRSTQRIFRYSVNLIHKDNKDIELVGELRDPDEGRFIEQKIEKFLKIQSKPVSGEYNG